MSAHDTMELTPEGLTAICPEAPASALDDINAIFDATECTTHLRMAMLVAQLAVESDQFRAQSEYGGEQRSYAPYYGRTWIQLTGWRNYKACGDALGVNLYADPDVALLHNVDVVAWFWNSNQLHNFSDVGDCDGCTRAINGPGATAASLRTRRSFYEKACEVLGGQS